MRWDYDCYEQGTDKWRTFEANGSFGSCFCNVKWTALTENVRNQQPTAANTSQMPPSMTHHQMTGLPNMLTVTAALKPPLYTMC